MGQKKGWERFLEILVSIKSYFQQLFEKIIETFKKVKSVHYLFNLLIDALLIVLAILFFLNSKGILKGISNFVEPNNISVRLVDFTPTMVGALIIIIVVFAFIRCFVNAYGVHKADVEMKHEYKMLDRKLNHELEMKKIEKNQTKK